MDGRRQQRYYTGKILGRGGYGYVLEAVEIESGRVSAMKKSRVSLRIKRPVLRHESRVLQLLQGHPAIPIIYGYAQLPHFEYLAMERLGANLSEMVTGPVSVITVVRVTLQLLSVLKYVHRQGFIHRDIKPENIMCRKTDPSKIVLIDFGIAIRSAPGPPRQNDRYKNSVHVIGTLHFASVNAHNGFDLGPRDDLESLSYVALYFLYGCLPWKGREKPKKNAGRRLVGEMKAALSGEVVNPTFPSEFGHLLDYSRNLEYDQIPDYEDLERRFYSLYCQLGGDSGTEEALDWTPVTTPVDPLKLCIEASDSDGHENRTHTSSSHTESNEMVSSFYFTFCVSMWDVRQRGSRYRTLTLPVEDIEAADSDIPEIVEVVQKRDLTT